MFGEEQSGTAVAIHFLVVQEVSVYVLNWVRQNHRSSSEQLSLRRGVSADRKL